MNEFLELKTVRFSKFSEIWRSKKMTFLCAGRGSSMEAREFMERAFLMVLDFFLPPYQFQVRVGGLYLLYALYETQPISPKAKVRITQDQWQETLQFQQEAAQQNHLDVVYVFNKMLQAHAFLFCFTPSEMTGRKTLEDEDKSGVNLADDLKDDRRDIESLFNYEAMEQLSYLLDHYQQMKVNLAGPGARQPDKSLDVVQGSMVEDLVMMLQSFKQSVGNIHTHGRPEPERQAEKNQTQQPSADESTGARRQTLKARAFSEMKRTKGKSNFIISIDGQDCSEDSHKISDEWRDEPSTSKDAAQEQHHGRSKLILDKTSNSKRCNKKKGRHSKKRGQATMESSEDDVVQIELYSTSNYHSKDEAMSTEELPDFDVTTYGSQPLSRSSEKADHRLRNKGSSRNFQSDDAICTLGDSMPQISDFQASSEEEIGVRDQSNSIKILLPSRSGKKGVNLINGDEGELDTDPGTGGRTRRKSNKLTNRTGQTVSTAINGDEGELDTDTDPGMGGRTRRKSNKLTNKTGQTLSTAIQPKARMPCREKKTFVKGKSQSAVLEEKSPRLSAASEDTNHCSPGKKQLRTRAHREYHVNSSSVQGITSRDKIRCVKEQALDMHESSGSDWIADNDKNVPSSDEETWTQNSKRKIAIRKPITSSRDKSPNCKPKEMKEKKSKCEINVQADLPEDLEELANSRSPRKKRRIVTQAKRKSDVQMDSENGINSSSQTSHNEGEKISPVNAFSKVSENKEDKVDHRPQKSRGKREKLSKAKSKGIKNFDIDESTNNSDLDMGETINPVKERRNVQSQKITSKEGSRTFKKRTVMQSSLSPRKKRLIQEKEIINSVQKESENDQNLQVPTTTKTPENENRKGEAKSSKVITAPSVSSLLQNAPGKKIIVIQGNSLEGQNLLKTFSKTHPSLKVMPKGASQDFIQKLLAGNGSNLKGSEEGKVSNSSTQAQQSPVTKTTSQGSTRKVEKQTIIGKFI